MKKILIFAAGVLLVLMVSYSFARPPFGFQAVPRDAFPVFNNPEMLTAASAEARGQVFPKDAVIGVALGKEAKAYPITVMGVHELGNDLLNGIPIAVSW